MTRRFIAVIEIADDYVDDKGDLACWIETALGRHHNVAVTVWDNLADFHADNVLDTLSEL